jgi:hypothetical protein
MCVIGSVLALLCLNCQPKSRDPAPVVLPATFLDQLKDGTHVEFKEDPARLARMTDSEFEELLATYRSSAASVTGASPAAIETAVEDLRRKRQAARAQLARPGGAVG